MTFFDFCEPSIEILPSFCLFRETPEIPDKIRRFVHLRQRREEVTCPILTPKSLLHMFRNKVTREIIQIAVEHEQLFIEYKIQTQPGEKKSLPPL